MQKKPILETRAVYCLFIFLGLVGCSGQREQSGLFDCFAKGFHAEMEKEFGLILMGQRTSGTTKLKKVTLDYCCYSPAEIRQARLLIHKLTDALLDKVNKTAALRPHFDRFPIKKEDLEISISFLDPETHGRWRRDSLTHASLFGGQIHYSSYFEKQESSEKIHQEKY